MVRHEHLCPPNPAWINQNRSWTSREPHTTAILWNPTAHEMYPQQQQKKMTGIDRSIKNLYVLRSGFEPESLAVFILAPDGAKT